MMTVVLNGDGLTQLRSLIQMHITPDVIQHSIIKEALADVEHIYKIEGLAMYSTDYGVKSPESLSNGMKTLILCTLYDKHQELLSSCTMGANVAKYIPRLSKEFDFTLSLDYFLNLPKEEQIDAVDSVTGDRLYTGIEFMRYYAGKAGVPE